MIITTRRASPRRASLLTTAFAALGLGLGAEPKPVVAASEQPGPAATGAAKASAAPARAPAAAKPSTPATPGLLRKGPKDAPITVVKFADFMCPGCQSVGNALTNYLRSNPDIQVVFRNFPLEQSCNPNVVRTIHVGACALALGGYCADEQGVFWPYHDRVFSRSWESATDREVIEVGVAAGADRAKFQTCLSASASAKSRLAQDVKDGFEANVRVTPTLIVNGQTLMNTNEFAQVVEAERRKVAGAGATTKK